MCTTHIMHPLIAVVTTGCIDYDLTTTHGIELPRFALFCKFLVRDRIHNDNIDTRNKWIDIKNLEVKDRWDRDGKYDPEILSFDAEIFDRTEQPIYDDEMTEDEKHQLTYEVAEGDIQKQRSAEKRTHKKVDRPSYHVDVATKHTKDRKTEYQVKNIKRKK